MSPKNSRTKTEFSKEDIQKYILGAMIALGVLVGFWLFVWKPLGVRIVAREKKLAEVKKTYDTAKALTDAAPKVATQYEIARTRLGNIMKAQLPPPVNPTAWVSDLFMQTTMNNRRRVNIVSIGSRGVQRLPHRRNTPAPLFEECLFNVSIMASYHDFGRFLAQLEKNNPFFRVDSLSLVRATSASSNGEHNLTINMSCAFPRLTEEGFPLEERPDAESPHVSKKVHAK